MAVQYYEGIGRRKESTARVRLMSGSGKFMVNDKEAAVYFTSPRRSEQYSDGFQGVWRRGREI